MKLMKEKNEEHCFKGSDDEKSQQVWRIGKNNQVGNVIVWIHPAEGTYFKIEEGKIDAALKNPVVLHQPHCAFQPHAQVAFPSFKDPSGKTVMTGQKFIAKNDAPIPHNTKWEGSLENTSKGENIPPGKEIEVKLKPSPKPVHFKCDVHAWMSAWAMVFDHPYAAASKAPPAVDENDAAYGSYEIKNVPTGVKVLVSAWHEEAGVFVKDEPLELGEKETTKDFELKPK
jgi:hypothetical protein